MCGYLILQTYPYPIQDMLSIIAKKGQGSDHIFKTQSENSRCTLRDKIDTQQHINWNEECVLVVASILKVGEGFTSPTLSIPLEMHTCFLSLRLHDDDYFLELWTHDLLIRGMVGKSLTNPKIYRRNTGEQLLLRVNFLICQMGFSLVLQMFKLISPLTIPCEVIADQVIRVGIVCFTKYMS